MQRRQAGQVRSTGPGNSDGALQHHGIANDPGLRCLAGKTGLHDERGGTDDDQPGEGSDQESFTLLAHFSFLDGDEP